MEVLLKWVTVNPWAGYLAAALLAVLVLTVVVTIIIALSQGRELQVWPPKLGPIVSNHPSQQGSQSLDIGLIAYSRDSHSLDNKAARIRAAKREVWMIGATMHYTLNNCRQLIVDRVASGLDVCLLIADPEGRDYESTARSFGQDRATLLSETTMTLDACRDIKGRLRNANGSFQVKLMDRVFTSGVYFFDPQLEDGTMLLVPHIPGHDAPVVPGFFFRHVQHGLLDDYFQIYKSVWNNAEKVL
ncbi:hypothetical protein [Methyloglobulus sp.]|uniref:hypothetical protein n=1 Tax=Methyloglobulus sp. TaxID=2518622 RepID=UPI0032B728EC